MSMSSRLQQEVKIQSKTWFEPDRNFGHVSNMNVNLVIAKR